jgi:Sulfotransferase family
MTSFLKDQKQIQKLLDNNNYRKAAPLLKKLNKNTLVANQQTLDLEAFCNFKLKNFLQAKLLWQRSLLKTVDNIKKCEVLEKLAKISLIENNPVQAQKYLLESVKIDDTASNLNGQIMLCEVSLTLEDHEIIEEFTPKLLSYEQSHIPALAALARAALLKGDKVGVLQYFSKFHKYIFKLSPSQVSFITHNYLKLNELSNAEQFISPIRKQYEQELWFKVLIAHIFLEKKEYQSVVDILGNSSFEQLPGWAQESGLYYTVQAKAFEMLGLFSQAFDCYDSLSKITKKKNESLKRYNALSAYKKLDLSKLTSNNTTQSPIFMLGFPRSGTTLLETILDAHPKISTLSEKETITKIANKLADDTKSPGFVHGLKSVTVSQLEGYASDYFEEVCNYMPDYKDNDIVIDKMPLYTIYLPLINMLFPNAKFIVNIRHPLDVILSNFQQNFAMNNEMSFLITLDDCVKRYIEVMAFLERIKSELALDFIQVRYEDLIEDLDVETRRLFDFLGTAPSKGVDKFYIHAQRKVINTASNAQVIKPLYQGSKYKWKNYKKQVEPYINVLKPFIELYGY